jgi:uncharacterized membrane protein
MKMLTNKLPARALLVDELRGLAIVLMIIFHFAYDLNIFGYVKINFSHDPFWWGLPRVIVFLFLLTVGISLCLAHKNEIKWRKFSFRLGKVVLCAALISITTYILFPESWIYFGTLHCIALTSIMAMPFLNSPRLSLLIFLALVIPSTIFKKNLPWPILAHQSMDYIPPFPWFGIVLLGIFLFHYNIHFRNPFFREYFLFKDGIRLMRFLGRHSLLIYLLHQPILFGSLWSINKLIK